MSSILEENLGFLHRKLVRGKDKNEVFLKQREFNLEVKKQNARLATVEQKDTVDSYNFISSDVWYQISRYIPPEDVQAFAMICKETAALTRTKSFWKHLFKKYCLKFGKHIWILQLPPHLQMNSIRDLSPQLFRTSVIEALFHCHVPFLDRVNCYTLDLLLGRDYISAWHKLWENCMWIMCYQFRQHGIKQRNTTVGNRNEEFVTVNFDTEEVVNDWESLAACDNNENFILSINDEYQMSCEQDIHPYEGVCLLVIFGHRFIPFPNQLISHSHEEKSPCLRLSATRRLLTSDMREYNLELDFLDTINKTKTTVKYPTVKHKVLPWWHPDFKKYIKYEACDKFS